MSTTPKAGIALIAQGDTVDVDAIDAGFTKADEQLALEQFLVRQADVTLTGGNLVVAYGRGQIRFPSGFVSFVAGTATFVTPAVSTSYDLVARDDGTVVLVASSNTLVAAQVKLWRVTTANPVATGTMVLADRRPLLAATDAITPTGVTAGTYGTGAIVPVPTVDQYGRVTGMTSAAVSASTANIADRAVTHVKVDVTAYLMAGVVNNNL